MPFAAAPPLPDFLARRLPHARTTYVLEKGAYAGRQMHLVDHGPRAGRAVVLLHGNPTWSFLWRRVVGALPSGDDGWRCVAPDLLGFGASEKLPRIADHRLADHADALAALVERLDLRDVVLVGQDWGGPLAAAVGARHPGRIAAVVLGNTSVLVPERPRGTAFHRFARLPVLSDLVFRGLNLPMRALARVQGDPTSIRGEVARAYTWPFPTWRSRAGPLALARMVPDGVGHDSVPELRRGEEWLRAFSGPLHLV